MVALCKRIVWSSTASNTPGVALQALFPFAVVVELCCRGRVEWGCAVMEVKGSEAPLLLVLCGA